MTLESRKTDAASNAPHPDKKPRRFKTIDFSIQAEPGPLTRFVVAKRLFKAVASITKSDPYNNASVGLEAVCSQYRHGSTRAAPMLNLNNSVLLAENLTGNLTMRVTALVSGSLSF